MRRLLFVTLCFLGMCSHSALADISSSFFRFSNFVGHHDAVVLGTTVSKEYSENGDALVTFAVQEYLDGIAFGDTIAFIYNESRCDYCFMFYDGWQSIVFVSIDGDGLAATGGGAGAFRMRYEHDVRLIIGAYQKHNDLFTTENKALLIDVYSRFSEPESKWRLLEDFYRFSILDKTDADFIFQLQQSDNSSISYRGFQIAREAGIDDFREYYEQLIPETEDTRKLLNYMSYLGDIRNPESISVILPLLDFPDDAIHRHAIFILGLFCMEGNDYLLETFLGLYPSEEDVGTRSALITAVFRAHNSTRALEILQELLDLEPIDWMREGIQRKIDQLELVAVETDDTVQFISVSPNPANPVTTIFFSLKSGSETVLSVYNISGQKVTTLVDSYLSAGPYRLVFNGNGLSSGVYFYRLESADFINTGKFTLLR